MAGRCSLSTESQNMQWEIGEVQVLFLKIYFIFRIFIKSLIFIFDEKFLQQNTFYVL